MSRREGFNQQADGLLDALRRHEVVSDRVSEAAASALGVNRTDSRCIDVIERRAQTTAGDLGREAGLTSGAVTAVIDRLEAKGLARRVPDPDDRRRVLVELTDQARDRIRALWRSSWQPFLDSLSEYSPGEIQAIQRFIDRQSELGETIATDLRKQAESNHRA